MMAKLMASGLRTKRPYTKAEKDMLRNLPKFQSGHIAVSIDPQT